MENKIAGVKRSAQSLVVQPGSRLPEDEPKGSCEPECHSWTCDGSLNQNRVP